MNCTVDEGSTSTGLDWPGKTTTEASSNKKVLLKNIISFRIWFFICAIFQTRPSRHNGAGKRSYSAFPAGLCLQLCTIFLLTGRYLHVYSHSMVAGGFELISYTTLFTPFTLLMMSLLTFARKS